MLESEILAFNQLFCIYYWMIDILLCDILLCEYILCDNTIIDYIIL